MSAVQSVDRWRRVVMLIAALAAVLLPWSAADAAAPAEVALAKDGRALQPVVVSENASERTRQAAAELAEYLGKISGAAFEVKTGDGAEGLVVGTAAEFPAVGRGLPGVEFKPEDPFRRDEYLLRTHAKGAYILGATDTAAHLAVWDFLHRLGYRLFFLTDTWEVVPSKADLRVAVDAFERPDWVNRSAPRGAPWSDNKLWARWRLRNRVESSFVLQTGHAYDHIAAHNKEAFAAHPEYHALVNGERKDRPVKFCISNPGLRKLIVDGAVETIKKNPRQDSVSMDPSDGGGWCECAECARMGSVSDRALTLANEVAAAINALGLGTKYVGIYAYNQHSPPPSIKVHPNVVVSVATSFIRGGYTVEELVEGWRAKGAILGIRDYHDVFTWSHDAPRRARGGNVAYLTRTIPYFHGQGARFMNSEAADSWGANGFGYWLSPRLLWDVDLAAQTDALLDDFVTHAFGPAREPMREFYRMLNFDYTSLRSSEDLVARMYRRLDEARKLTSDPKIRARLDDLVLYTRYVELYNNYREASGPARQAGFEQIWRHAYRMRDRYMMLTAAICNRERYRDKAVSLPEGVTWNTPEGEHPWKSSEPFGEAEIAAILRAGIEANEPTELDFEPVTFSQDLVPATRLSHLTLVAPGKLSDTNRGTHRIYTWLPEGRKEIELKVTGGLIAHYRDRGNVEITLHAEQEATLEAVATDKSVPPDGQERTVTLKTPYSGLHVLEWSDGSDMTRVVFPDDLPLTVRSTPDDRARLASTWDLYFYVPRGTKVVGGYATEAKGKMLDGSGKEVFAFDSMKQADYFSVKVPPGEDGKLWKFAGCTGDRMLMTVPPYLAPSVERLLLPKEVVEREGK